MRIQTLLNPAGLMEWARFVVGAFEKIPDRLVAPVGDIKPWPGDPTVIPGGWLAIDGSVVDPVAFPELAAVLGTRFRLGSDLPSVVRLPAAPVGLWPGMTWVIKT